MPDPKNTKTTSINIVKPNNSLFFGPMPCENRAAAIRNKTVDNMTNNEIAAVAYRYLQNRRAERSTLREATFWSVAAISVFMISRRSYKLLPSLLFSMPQALHIPPNIGNTIRYRETKNSCEDLLNIEVGKDTFQEIQKLKFNQQGIFALNALMKSKGINSTSIANQHANENLVPACWKI